MKYATAPSLAPTFIDVMRHGEPEGICEHGGMILRGSIDHALTDKGWLQAKSRIESLESWDVVVSSPLVRCSAFAHWVVSENKSAHPNAILKESWRELHYGDWEGLSTHDIWKESPELMGKLWQQPLEFCAPNGESVKDFGQRIEDAWASLLDEFQGKRILLVCHGGVMRVLLQQLLSMAPEAMNRFAIPYAAMSRFRVDHSISKHSKSEHSIKNNERQDWPSLITHLGDECVKGEGL